MDKPWQPANRVEAALRDALARDDQQRYVTVLAESVLLVPVQAAEAQVPRLVGVRTDDGRIVVPVYTSPEALAHAQAQVESPQHVPVSFTGLSQVWPDPTWDLAIDPGLPVAGQISGAELPAIVAWVFAPANQAERELAEARRPAQVLAALAVAELHLPVQPAAVVQDPSDPAFPWWREPVHGQGTEQGTPTVVPVFTSMRRLRGGLGLAHPDVASVDVDLLTLAESWPDPQWIMVLNPGAPYAVTLPGEQVRAIGDRMPEALGALVRLQVLLPPDLVASYLEHGYARVAGVVHMCKAEPVPIARLYEELGLLRPGSPFSAADESVHAIRWPPGPEVGAKWVRDPSPRTETVDLPGGAQFVELRPTGDDRLLATYEPDHGWVPTG